MDNPARRANGRRAGVGDAWARVFRAVRAALSVGLAAAALAGCATIATRSPVAAEQGRGWQAPYQVDGRWYYPHAQPSYDRVGLASWYGAKFHNRRTADGELFDQNAPSAAHTTLPLPSIVEVTNLANGRRIRVRLNDRGPFVDGRILDLSRAAAAELGFEREGVARVRVRYVGPAPLAGAGVRMAAARRNEVEASETRPEALSETPPETQPEALENSEPPPGPPPSPPSGRYAVQVGAFSTRENADRAAAQLTQAGPTSVEPVPHDGGAVYRVVVGVFADQRAAAAALSRAADAGFVSARMVAVD